MSALRLVCHVSAADGETLPRDDDHPYNVVLDDLGEAIAEFARRRDIDPDQMTFEGEDGQGSLLTMSSDVPDYADYFWIYLPNDARVQAEMLPVILQFLEQARDVLPGSSWDVSLGAEKLIWNEGRLHLLN